MRGAASHTKQPSLYRVPILPELVIPDLKEMERSGRDYNREVLLWLQDGYVHQAINEHLPQLRALHAALAESGGSPEDVCRKKMQALVEFTCVSYAAEKAAGRGVDLKGHAGAQKTFFEAESARHGGHLQGIAEYIKKAVESGKKPDVNRLSRHAFESFGRLNQVRERLEGLRETLAAVQVMNMMKKGAERLYFITIEGQPTNIGRQLWKAVETISENPSRYVDTRDPSRVVMPERGPLDYEPMRRKDGFGDSF